MFPPGYPERYPERYPARFTGFKQSYEMAI